MADIDDILARIERLEAENAELRQLLGDTVPTDSRRLGRQRSTVEDVRVFSRRGVLGMAGRTLVALGAGVAATSITGLATISPALAGNGDSLILGRNDNSATGSTNIDVLASPATVGFSVVIFENGADRTAITGQGAGKGGGVGGWSPSGPGISGASITGTGVRGTSFGTADGVVGEVDLSGASTAAGVRGRNAKGRGGVFSGGKAQVRLEPGTRTSHPTSGVGGDLYVDQQKRLWFCQGGSNWKQIA
jgi:hypothetical protein